MSDQENKGTLLNIKRVREAQNQGKAQNQDQIVVTVGLNQDGTNEFDTLLEVLQQYKGKQVNFDIRITTKTTDKGASYRTGFLIVKEMIPRGATAGTTKTVWKAKTQAENIRKNFG